MKLIKKEKTFPIVNGMYMNHERPPVTRRDFLSRSVGGFMGYVMTPTLLGMIWREQIARADGLSCPTASGNGDPFLVIDVSGGFGIAGNWVPMDSSGAKLATYNSLGMGTNTPSVNTMFGAPMAGLANAPAMGTGTGFSTAATGNTSKVFEGILAAVTPATAANFRMGAICNQSADDVSSNQLSALIYAASSGLTGSLIKSPLGLNISGGFNGNSGGNSSVPAANALYKPLAVTQLADITNSVSYGTAFANFSKAEKDQLANASMQLSQQQVASLSGMNLADQFANLAQCGYQANQGFTSPPTALSPTSNAAIAAIYGLNGTGAAAPSTATQAKAGIVYNVLMGNSGPGVLTLGGYDYHQQGQTQTDSMDRALGVEIGRAVQSAAALGKRLVIQILTNGAVTAAGGSRTWIADSGNKSMTILGVYDPKAANPSFSNRTQLGYYTSGEVASTTPAFGGNPALVAAIIYANLAQMRDGNLDKLNNVVPQTVLDGRSSTTQSYLLFDKKAS